MTDAADEALLTIQDAVELIPAAKPAFLLHALPNRER